MKNLLLEIAKMAEPFETRCNRPWTQNGNSYATDKRIAVEVFQDLGFEPNPEKAPNVAGVMVENIDQLPKLIFLDKPTGINGDCDECDGTGRDGTVDCISCRGTGDHECSCGNVHPCPACGGRGYEQSKEHCKACNGSGRAISFNYAVDICGIKLNAKYILLAMRLPNVRFHHQNDANKPVFFTFDGGRGAIMPMVR